MKTLKINWRMTLFKHGLRTMSAVVDDWIEPVMKSRKAGDYVSGRRAAQVIVDLESERDEARAEVERLRGEVVRSEKAKSHLISKLQEQRKHPLSDAVIAEMWPEMNSVEGRAEIRRQYDALVAEGW